MNQEEKKSTLVPGTDMPELDLELTEMAEEVPPMPADFHAGWMKAVREEAGKRQETAGRTEGKVVAFTKGPWFRALSFAAVFVFLIGGTVLYRAGKRSIAPVYPAEMRVAETAPESAADMGAELMVSEEAEEASMAAEAAGSAEKAKPVAGFSGNAAESVSFEADANAVHQAASASLKAEAAETEAAGEEAAEAPASEAPEAEDTAEAPAEEPAPGFLQQAGGFLSDMGAFLLSVWPWLAGAAVILAAWAVVRKMKRR